MASCVTWVLICGLDSVFWVHKRRKNRRGKAYKSGQTTGLRLAVFTPDSVLTLTAVSYTHLTLPTMRTV